MSSAKPTGRSYDSRRRQDAARRNRAAVLTACQQLLLGVGYRATTIQAVAERAGVSPVLIYKTFGGKAGMLKALWDVTLAGDDDPSVMAERAQLRAVWATADPTKKLDLYAEFVRGVHERLAALHAMLIVAGPEAAEVLSISDQERLTGVRAFVAHLADESLLYDGIDQTTSTDACWVLTGADVFTRLTTERGWNGNTYQRWLVSMLATSLLDPEVANGCFPR